MWTEKVSAASMIVEKNYSLGKGESIFLLGRLEACCKADLPCIASLKCASCFWTSMPPSPPTYIRLDWIEVRLID